MSPRRSEYLGLSNESQIRNAKNLRVNAQVTAVVTIFEVVGMCIIVMTHVLVFQHGFTRFHFVYQYLFMLLHYVLLPYAFLMNTTSNKNRIVEDGWMNVLKNMVLCYKCNIAPASGANDTSSAVQKTINVERKPDILEISLRSKSSQSGGSEKAAVKPFPKSIEGERKKPDFEMQKPNCSYKYEESKKISNALTEKGSKIKGTKSIDSFRKTIISDLLTSIDDEYTYTKILTHFVDAEEAHKAGKRIDTSNHNYEEFKIDTLPNFVGSSKRKSAMRTSKLQTLLHIRKETDNYNINFEQFVDMEENFVENGCQ